MSKIETTPKTLVRAKTSAEYLADYDRGYRFVVKNNNGEITLHTSYEVASYKCEEEALPQTAIVTIASLMNDLNRSYGRLI